MEEDRDIVADSAAAQDSTPLFNLERGTMVLVGEHLVRVPDDIVAAFMPGDRLLAVAATGTILHVPRAEAALVEAAVRRAHTAFATLAGVPDDMHHGVLCSLCLFVGRRRHLAIDCRCQCRRRRAGACPWSLDHAPCRRREDAAGYDSRTAAWQDMPSQRGAVVATSIHEGWTLDHVLDGLGVVAFVFEGRPNVFADAAGILRGGNTAVMRIGSDALGTARAINTYALRPALAATNLPEDAVVLLESSSHAAGWSLFAHPRVALAVARGSGPAVAQLGAIARQAGTPASLHGTGGSWIVADATADAARFRAAVYHSLDRKVCNTVNTICIVRERAADLVPLVADALRERVSSAATYAGYGAPGYKLHVTPSAEPYVPRDLFSQCAVMLRATGPVEEPIAVRISDDALGHEWEWEATPEVSLTVVADVAEAVALFNAQSPLFGASLISEDPSAHEVFFRTLDAPFVGDGFTRWVDGQYALDRPELGLSNWQNGRLFARGAILSGDGVYTVRYRARQSDLHLHR